MNNNLVEWLKILDFTLSHDSTLENTQLTYLKLSSKDVIIIYRYSIIFDHETSTICVSIWHQLSTVCYKISV